MQSDRFDTTPTVQKRAVDEGLRTHLNRIYNRMTVGVLITGVVAYAVANTGLIDIIYANTMLKMAIMFGPLAVIMFGFNPSTMPASKLKFSFGLISVLYGLSFAAIFMIYTGTDIARAFFIASGAFAGLSIFGYTTKKDLSGFGSFIVMGVWGLLILSVVNMFMESSLMMNIISAAGILIFGGLVAWETQRMKEMYSPSYGDEANNRMAWMSALNLYISFVAMFQYILHFVGGRD